MPSFRSYFLKKGIKIATNRLKGIAEKGMDERRQMLDTAAKRWSKLPKNCRVEPFQIEGLYAEWLTNNQTLTDKVILYLHGGAYEYCSANTHRSLAARIMGETGIRVLLPEYRLAPEHPFPAAIEDTVSIYRWLQKQGYAPSNIIFAGDSSGAGLSVATTLLLRDQNEPLPAAVICLSPWVDLTSSGESYTKNSEMDPYLKLDGVKAAARLYAGSEPLDHRLISPVFDEFSGFPPLFIQVGSCEILLSDAEMLAHQARQAGVNVSFKTWDGMWHVWQVSRKLPEAKKAIKEIGEFIKETFKLPKT
jgi:monoterpene epsilon-lactone hydrolase